MDVATIRQANVLHREITTMESARDDARTSDFGLRCTSTSSDPFPVDYVVSKELVENIRAQVLSELEGKIVALRSRMEDL